MNSQENKKQKNSDKIIDDFYNSCKKANLKKIENILSSSNNNLISNYIIDEAIRIVIRNFNPQNLDFLKTLSYLLKFNTDINFKNESQNNATILMEAACSEKIEVLNTLLNFFEIKKNIENSKNTTLNASNINLNLQNSCSKVKSHNSAIVEDKKETAGSSSRKGTKNISTSISMNENNNNINFNNNHIINNCLDLNIKDNDGQTVLHKIINSGTLDESYKFSSLTLLIEKGADVNEENILGYTPLSLSLLIGNYLFTEYLIKSGAGISHVISANNENMLHCAVRGKNPSVIHLLQNADLKHKNKHGETPYDLANNLKLLSFKEFFDKIDAENYEINLNNKIISSMLPINDIINKNYGNVLLHLQELKGCLKINNSEMRFIWNALLAEYFSFFETELFISEGGQLNEKDNFTTKNTNIITKNKESANLGFKNILVSNNSNSSNNSNFQQQENINSSNINLNTSSTCASTNIINSQASSVSDVLFAAGGNFVVKNSSNNKKAKRNRKNSNTSSGNTNSSAVNANLTNTAVNTNNNHLIKINEYTNNDDNNSLNNCLSDKTTTDNNKKKNRQYFIEKFIDFFNHNEKSESDNEHKKILYYNSGLFWFKFTSYSKCLEQLLNCLKISSKKDDFLFYTNSSLIFINILQNMQEFQLANKVIEALELYLNKNQANSNNKLSNKSLLNSMGGTMGSSGQKAQISQSGQENYELLNTLNKKSFVNLYNQREIINTSNSHEELNCILNILKSQNFLYEEKLEDCRKNLKEYKRIWNKLILKDSLPMLNTLKKIYHGIKIRLHYLNNNINKGLKHLNFFSNFFSKNDQENLTMQIFKLNNFGILNLKQKKISFAQFNFKNGLNLLKKISFALNFNLNTNQMAETLLFNLALSYFFEKKFEACYRTLRKIKQEKIICNPFYLYRLGISCLEIELAAVRKKNAKAAYNDLLEKYNVKNSQFNSKDMNDIVDYSFMNMNNENKDENKDKNIQSTCNKVISPGNNEYNNKNNNNLNDNSENEIKNDNPENANNANFSYKVSQVYNSFFILKNTEKLFFESEKISESINHFISLITIIKNYDYFNFHKELSELWEFFNLKNNINNTTNNNNNNNPKNKNYKIISNNQNNENILPNITNNQTDNSNKAAEKFEKHKTFPKSPSKSFSNILLSSYLNLLFCLSLKNRWTEMLFYLNDLEAYNNFPSVKELNYTLDNYKIEAYLGLNQSYKVIELLKKNMANGNYTYTCLDAKANFFSNKMGDVSPEINLKVALYSNVIKLNFLNNNILEVEKGIVKLIGLFNMNLNLNQTIENISLPTYLINLLIYYYLIKEKFDTAVYLIKKRRLPPGSFVFLLESTSKNMK